MAKLSDILGKAEVAAALGADGVAALQAIFDETEKGVKEERAKAGRILAEKKELQDKLAALEADIETVKAKGLPEAEKAQAELTKANKRAEAAEAKLAQTTADFAKAKRTVALDKIAQGVKYIDVVTPQAGRTLLEQALAGVENMEDETTVAAALAAFKENNKTLIASESQGTGGGTGRPGAGASGGGVPNDPTKQTVEQRRAVLLGKK